MLIFVLGFIGCTPTPVDICRDKLPESAIPIEMTEIHWDDGPEYDVPQGWTGVVYTSQEQWDTFISENDLEAPNISIDFAVSDVFLYERIHNGCDFEVVFDGAYLLEGIRYIRTQYGNYDAHSCDFFDNRHVILVVEKVDGADVSFCSPYESNN